MSKDLQTKETQLPAEWQEELAQEAKELASVERPSVSSISFRGGVMKYMGEKIKGNQLDVIIISAIQEQTLYKGSFDPDNAVPPDCFAQGFTGTPMIPHENVREPEAEGCDGCPMNQWGSADGNSKGKACKETRKLAVIPADAIEDLESLGKAEIAIMKIPVTSVRNWSNYVRALQGQHSRPAWTTITRVSCEPDDKTQFKVNFELVELIDVDILQELKSLKTVANDSLMVPYEAAPEESGKY